MAIDTPTTRRATLTIFGTAPAALMLPLAAMRCETPAQAATYAIPMSAADGRAIGVFSAALAGIPTLPIALAANANSRPISEAECVTTADTLMDGRWADVRTCRVVGVIVSSASTPLLTKEG